MTKEGNAKLLRLGQQRPEGRMVEMPVARAPAQQCTFQTEIANGTLKLKRRSLWVGGGQAAKPWKRVG